MLRLPSCGLGLEADAGFFRQNPLFLPDSADFQRNAGENREPRQIREHGLEYAEGVTDISPESRRVISEAGIKRTAAETAESAGFRRSLPKTGCIEMV